MKQPTPDDLRAMEREALVALYDRVGAELLQRVVPGQTCVCCRARFAYDEHIVLTHRGPMHNDCSQSGDCS